MTDGVAMLTKAKENIMFTMAAMSLEQRYDAIWIGKKALHLGLVLRKAGEECNEMR